MIVLYIPSDMNKFFLFALNLHIAFFPSSEFHLSLYADKLSTVATLSYIFVQEQ